MVSRNNSLFSSREQRIDFPSALIRVNDSTLEISGFIANPRPCTFEERLPPSVNVSARSEEHTSELQSRRDLVCRLLLEKKQTCSSTATSSGYRCRRRKTRTRPRCL